MTYTIAPNERPIHCASFDRYAPKKLWHKPIAVYDCETADGTLLGPIAGIALTSDRDSPNVIRFGNHENIGGPAVSFLKHILTKQYRGYVFYAHKGLSFDLSHILANESVIKFLNKNGFTVLIDRSFATIKKAKQVWTFGDSMRIVPEKLENVLKAFAPQYIKTELPTEPFSWHNPKWIARIENDTLGLYAALKTVEEIVREKFKVSLSLTTSSTALRAARSLLPFDQIKRPCQRALDWIRAAGYSGGRVEVFHQGEVTGNIRIFDINSAYAWALKGEFPLGAGRYTTIEPKKGMYIARCKLDVPTGTVIPPVLSRLYHRSFPVGSFEAMLSNEEVAFARNAHIYVKFLEGWAWNQTAPIFREFIRRCETLRAEDYHGPLGKFVKLIQNSLYGLLGMSPIRLIHTLSQTDPGLPWVHAFNSETEKYMPNVFEGRIWKESPNQMAHWAAIITARVRVRLTKYLYLFEREGYTPLYCHTDSIWTVCPNGITPAIKEHLVSSYGGLKIEHEGNRAVIVAPGEALLTGCACKDCQEKSNSHVTSKGWPGKDHLEFFERDKPTTIKMVQMYRAATAMKRGRVGIEIPKNVVNFNSMRNRKPAKTRPGATVARTADLYDYSYWHFTNWFTGKFWTVFPKQETALIETPWEKQFREKERRAKIHRNRSAGQQRRLDREFSEGYAAWILDQEERRRYNIHAGKPEQEAGPNGESRRQGGPQEDRGEAGSESSQGDFTGGEPRPL